jgi:hypothetical protein
MRAVKPRPSSIKRLRWIVAALGVLLLFGGCTSDRYVIIANGTSRSLQVQVSSDAQSVSAGAVAAGQRKRVDIPPNFEHWQMLVDDSLVASWMIGDALLVEIAADGAVSVRPAT